MNPGLVVKLRPNGPWRIGPDSGSRNRVETIYHSDSLYSAVTWAIARLGFLDSWLAATARSASPAVSFSSCFPFLDEIGFIAPPRTIWPPSSPALLSARVRWKSARFIPLGVVQAILTGHTLDDSHWAVDGASECLVPAGRIGPFRAGARWSAAVDRLTGATERHSAACVEFHPGAGLWTIVSFADDAAHSLWLEKVKAAFRLLADSGFGGERSRGWGYADAPEFVEGALPDMILHGAQAINQKAANMASAGVPEPADARTNTKQWADTPVASGAAGESERPVELSAAEPAAPSESAVPEPSGGSEIPVPETVPTATVNGAAVSRMASYWLLSLFAPAPADSVDWGRGNYALVARGGRVESAAGSGQLKKQVRMIAEGSVLYAAGVLRGAAPDVAPDGFAHPVFRAGFAVAIPLPEAS
jgi:CRISPR type III-A-associated RAMP protein Csm4